MVGDEQVTPEKEHREEMIALQLYSDQEKKIERIREEASEVLRTLIQHGQKIDTLSERLNEGVAKTGIKTWEKVNEISNQFVHFKNEHEKLDIRTQNNEKILNRFTTGVFWVTFIGVLGGLVSFTYWIAQNLR